MRLLLLALFLISNVSFAEQANTIIENLISEDWKPLDVRVEWTFRKSSRQDLNPAIEYRIAQPQPTRFAGNLILKLEGVDSEGRLQTVPVSGKAKIFGRGFTTNKYITSGTKVSFDQLDRTELEWTRLNNQPVTQFEPADNYIAARGLVPGRTICKNDLKPEPVILKGQSVTLEMSDNTITISLVGRALADGSVGENIPVAVELEHTKRYRGIVVNETTVRFIQ